MNDNITLPREVVKFVLQHLEWWSDDEPQEKEAITALRAALAAEPTKQESVESDDDEEFTRKDVTTLLLEVMDWTYAQAHRNRPMTEAEQKVLDDIRTALAAEQPVPTDKDSLTVQSRLDAESFREERDEARALLNGVLQDIEALRRDAEQPKPEPVAVFDEQMGHPVLLLGSPMLKDKQPLYTAPPATHPGYVIGSHWLETAYSRICAGEAEADVLRDIGLVREEAFLTGVAHLKAENEALRRDAERYRWLRDNAAGFSGRTLDAITDAAINAAMGDKT